MIKLEKIVMLQELKRKGLSISAIAQRTGLDRKTVRKHLGRGLAAPAYSPREPRPRRLEPYEGYLAGKIGNCPDLSGLRLFREIQELGYDGSYSAVTAHLRAIRPNAAPRFERRFETQPGEQAQADFAEFKTGFADEPGVVRIEGASYRPGKHADLIPEHVRTNAPITPPPPPKKRGRPRKEIRTTELARRQKTKKWGILL